MGYHGRIELKKKAQALRQTGKSYLEIMSLLGIPKATVSDWCKDIVLTKKQEEQLYRSKRIGALKGSLIAAKRKKQKKEAHKQDMYRQGVKEVGRLNKRERFIAGVAYYSAEGTKTDKGCVFANADPDVIKFMTEWFREFGGVDPSRYRGAIWIHEEHDEKKAIGFWSDLTGIPAKAFYKSYIVKNVSNGVRKHIHPYGVFSLYISDVALQRKIMGWIGGILKKPGAMV